MNRLFCFFISLLFCLTSFAQVKNYAVAFDGNSDINFNCISELNNLSKYTVQFWMYPSEWIPGASIFKRGAGANILRHAWVRRKVQLFFI